MNAPAREEIDAKLETIEVRMDGRVAAIEVKIDALMGLMNERFNRIDERMGLMNGRMGLMDDRMGRLEGENRETRASIGGLKTTMIVTALSSVIAIVLGVATFNATLFSNTVSLFESGRKSGIHEAELKRQIEATGIREAELKRQTEATAALLKQLQAQIAPARK